MKRAVWALLLFGMVPAFALALIEEIHVAYDHSGWTIDIDGNVIYDAVNIAVVTNSSAACSYSLIHPELGEASWGMQQRFLGNTLHWAYNGGNAKNLTGNVVTITCNDQQGTIEVQEYTFDMSKDRVGGPSDPPVVTFSFMHVGEHAVYQGHGYRWVSARLMTNEHATCYRDVRGRLFKFDSTGAQSHYAAQQHFDVYGPGAFEWLIRCEDVDKNTVNHSLWYVIGTPPPPPTISDIETLPAAGGLKIQIAPTNGYQDTCWYYFDRHGTYETFKPYAHLTSDNMFSRSSQLYPTTQHVRIPGLDVGKEYTVFLVCRDTWQQYSPERMIRVTVDPFMTLKSPETQTALLPKGTKAAKIVVRTADDAVCSISKTPNAPFSTGSMTQSQPDRQEHFAIVGGDNIYERFEDGKAYTFYVQCMNWAPPHITPDFPITLTVATEGVDTEPPVILHAYGDSNQMTVYTNELALCRYAYEVDMPYASMPLENEFGRGYHASINSLFPVEPFVSGTYYIRCEDIAGNTNTVGYPLTLVTTSSGTVYTPQLPGSPECTVDDDCGADKVCRSETCVTTLSTGCSDTNPCPEGQVCESDVCYAPPPPNCLTDDDCPEGMICSDVATCVQPYIPPCESNADCASGFVCATDGSCQVEIPSLVQQQLGGLESVPITPSEIAQQSLFAPSWDVFAGIRPLVRVAPDVVFVGNSALVRVDHSGNDVKLTYEKAYVKNMNNPFADDWMEFRLSGIESQYPGFLTGDVVAEIPASLIVEGLSYVAVHACTSTLRDASGQLRYACGCQDTSLTSCGKWNLERFVVIPPIPGSPTFT